MLEKNSRPPHAARLVAIFLSFVAACVARAADEFGSWHTLSLGVLENERWKLTALGQVRFRDHSSQLFAYVLSPQVEFKASPYLRVGLNYTYLPAKPAGRSRFLDQKRWEFELNPRWPVSEQLTLDLRNRYELRWIEGRAGINERSRHRPQATFRLRHAGPLESVFAHHEIFYDYVLHRRTETRLVPAGFNFRLSPRAGFQSYYLIRSVLAAREWTHSQVIGTQFSIKL